MLKNILKLILTKNEKRIGVTFDYAHKIIESDSGLFLRYGKIFSFLDPRKHLPTDAYHTARICGALSADCGTCVEAEVNLAKNSGLDSELIILVVSRDFKQLSPELRAVAELSEAVTQSLDAVEARAVVLKHYGANGLIELAYAMNGAALLPGIKRAMGYATSCDIEKIRKFAWSGIVEDNKSVQSTADASAD